eukprot:1656456-Prymnesium_polylepis.1
MGFAFPRPPADGPEARACPVPSAAPPPPRVRARPRSSGRELASMPPERQRLVTLGHLEHQMAAATALGSAAEYREWARLYVRRERPKALASWRARGVLRFDHMI